MPASSPLRHAVFLQAIAGGRHAAQGVSWVGLASLSPDLQSGVGAGVEPATLGLTVRCSIHLSYPVVACRNRTGDFGQRPLLYPTRANAIEKHLLPRSGIRCGSAARTGRDASPYRCSVFDRCSPLPAVANRQSVRAPCALVDVLPTRSPRRGITTQRTGAGRSRAPASGRARALPGCPRAETNFRDGKKRTSMHAHPPRTLETKRPRGLRPEGVRVSSGDRGGRSPWESAGCQVARCRAGSLPGLASNAYARTRRPQRDGCRSSVLAMECAGFMEIILVKKQPQGPKAAHDTRVVFVVQHFFNCGIASPTSGIPSMLRACAEPPRAHG